jgi:cbb3-type cytochrome oxidase maturation protein
MDILYLLIPLSVVLVLLIAGVLWYAVRAGQFDDLKGPAFKILLDDDRPISESEQHERKGSRTGPFDIDQTGSDADK